MDPTTYLAALSKMLEQRLGLLGYYLGTIGILAAWMTLVALPIVMIANLIRLYNSPVLSSQMSLVLLMIASIFTGAVVSYSVYKILFFLPNRGLRKKVERLEKEISELKEMLQRED